MKLTDHLRAEHDVFLTQISQLEAMLEHGTSAKAVAIAVLVLARAVAAHARAEHELLFPAMVEAWGGDLGLAGALAREDASLAARAEKIAGSPRLEALE